MSTNLQDITLQSADGVLVATNEAGHLTYPMLHLNRQPTPEDARGWDRVLVFVDGDGSLRVHPAAIELNEENNYFQSLYVEAEGKWAISGVVAEFIQLESSSGQLEGVGNARIDISKATSLSIPGEYSCFFIVALTNVDGTEIRVPVYIVLNVLLRVNNRGNGETLTINLNNANDYTQLLTIIRDREWSLENVNTNIINVSPMSGNGSDLPDFTSTLTVTKSPTLKPALTEIRTTTTFQVVSLFQRVNVVVTIIIPAITATLAFVDPRPGEAGATGNNPLYLYF